MTEFGVERGVTPIGNMKSLEAIQKEIQERERKQAEAKAKAKKEAEAAQNANNAR